MVDIPKPDVARVPNKPAHFGFHGNTVGAQLCFWNDEWHFVTYPTLVQVKSGEDRQHTDLTS